MSTKLKALLDAGNFASYSDFVKTRLKPLESAKADLIHCALGIAGEAGEFVDAVKKHAIYGQPLDRENLIEELGDLRFYMTAMQNKFGISDDDVLSANVEKLLKRYKKSYSDAEAKDRADKQEEGLAKIPQEFFNFLSANDLLLDFLDLSGMNTDDFRLWLKNSSSAAVADFLGGFSWTDSPQGWKFWANVNVRWNEYVMPKVF